MEIFEASRSNFLMSGGFIFQTIRQELLLFEVAEEFCLKNLILAGIRQSFDNLFLAAWLALSVILWDKNLES